MSELAPIITDTWTILSGGDRQSATYYLSLFTHFICSYYYTRFPHAMATLVYQSHSISSISSIFPLASLFSHLFQLLHRNQVHETGVVSILLLVLLVHFPFRVLLPSFFMHLTPKCLSSKLLFLFSSSFFLCFRFFPLWHEFLHDESAWKQRIDSR